MNMADQILQVPQRIIACHREGLDRAVRLAVLSPNYSDILNGKVAPRHLELFDGDAPLNEKVAAAVEENRVALNASKWRVVQLRHSGATCFGATRNNLREFEFFDSLVSAGSSILDHNLSNASRVEYEINESDRAIADAILADVGEFYSGLENLNSSIFHQQFLYTRSYLNFAFALRDPEAIPPSLFVISNDHMPVHVAVSLAMKAMGVPRIYMQHAEVSEAFPPLDFEFSVLRSEQSLQTYGSIGPISGKTYIIPRASANLSIDALRQARGSGADIVVYPTARILEAKLKLAVNRLKGNPFVRSVAIKPHPNSSPPIESVLAGAGVEFLREIPAGEHIALVGNSSIAVELLRAGTQVYQIFDIDPIDKDYYGFVAEGLVPEAPLSKLSGKFWGSYPIDERWLEAFRRRIPSEDGISLQAKLDFVSAVRPYVVSVAGGESLIRPMPHRRPLSGLAKRFARKGVKVFVRRAPHLASRVAGAIRRQITEDAGNGSRRPTRAAGGPPEATGVRRALLVQGISAARSPAEFLARCLADGFVSELDAIIVLDQLFQNRDPAINELFKEASVLDGPSEIWLLLKKAEWTLARPEEGEARRLAGFVYSYQANSWIRRKLEDLLLTVLLQTGSRDEIDRFFSNTPTRPPQELSLNRQVALLRRLSHLGASRQELQALRQSFEAKASPFNQLKLRNMDALEGLAPAAWRHQDAERDFSKSAPANVAREFKAEVLPVYESLRTRLALIDVRNAPDQLATAREMITSSLKDGMAFSLLRLSDGEAYFFTKDARFFSPDDVANRERHWWGCELPDQLRKEIQDLGSGAVKAADIVGIPSVYRFIRDTSDRSESLMTGLQGRGLIEVLNGVEAAISDRAILTEDKINICLFGRPDDAASIARMARKTVLVSSVEPSVLPDCIKDLNIQTVQVPTHYRTSTNANYSRSDRPLPFVYQPMLAEVEAASGPGVLVLVAGGIVGKLFVGAAKMRGAVAVDIGSVVDDWAAGSVASLR